MGRDGGYKGQCVKMLLTMPPACLAASPLQLAKTLDNNRNVSGEGIDRKHRRVGRNDGAVINTLLFARSTEVYVSKAIHV